MCIPRAPTRCDVWMCRLSKKLEMNSDSSQRNLNEEITKLHMRNLRVLELDFLIPWASQNFSPAVIHRWRARTSTYGGRHIFSNQQVSSHIGIVSTRHGSPTLVSQVLQLGDATRR